MSPMSQLYLRNAKKVECASAFPPTAISVTVRISKIVVALCQFLPGPASSQVGIAIGQ